MERLILLPFSPPKCNVKTDRMMRKGRVILAGLAIAGLAVLNFTQAGGEVVSNVQASTSACVSVSQESEVGHLAWSAPIRCHKKGSGDEGLQHLYRQWDRQPL